LFGIDQRNAGFVTGGFNAENKHGDQSVVGRKSADYRGSPHCKHIQQQEIHNQGDESNAAPERSRIAL